MKHHFRLDAYEIQKKFPTLSGRLWPFPQPHILRIEPRSLTGWREAIPSARPPLTAQIPSRHKNIIKGGKVRIRWRPNLRPRGERETEREGESDFGNLGRNLGN